MVSSEVIEKQTGNKIKTPSIKKNFFLSTAYEVLCLITPFITAPYLARVLGAEKIGVNSYVHSILAYFTMLGALGTASYGSREIARVRDDAYERSKRFWEIELLSVFTSTIATIGWIVFILCVNQYKIYYIILTLSLFDTMFNINWFYAGMEQFKYTVFRNTFIKILGIVLVFVFVKKPEHLGNFIFINAACNLFGTLSMWVTLKKFLVKVKIKEIKIFSHLKGTIVYFVPAIATSIYTVLDKTLIGLITHDESQNGFYEQANKIIGMVKVFTFGSLNSVLESRSSYLFAQKKYDEIKARILKSIDYIMLIGIGSSFGILGVANRFIPVFFGEGYEAAIPLLRVFTPVIIIIGISRTLGAQYYTPSGKRLKSAVYIIVGSVTNLICNILLIPRFQSMGAVIGTIVSQLVITTLYMIFCNGYLRLGQILKVSWRKLIAGLIMFGYLMLINYFISNDLICLIVQITGGLVTYIVSLFAMRDQFLINYLISTFTKKFKKKNRE